MIYILRTMRDEANIFFLNICVLGIMEETLLWYFYLLQISEVGINMNIVEMRKVSLMDD